MTDNKKILLMTIGAPGSGDQENYFFRPLKDLINNSNYTEVFLLPSFTTLEPAEKLKAGIGDKVIKIHNLPENKEGDIDACFDFFDKLMQDLRKDFSPSQIVADFTRGTKAMSGALSIAAVRHGIAELRYVDGTRHGDASGVKTGTEEIKDTKPFRITFARHLDICRNLLEKGSFAAVSDLLHPDYIKQEGWGEDKELSAQAEAGYSLSSFLAAWDRLDYAQAQSLTLQLKNLPQDWSKFVPNDDIKGWIQKLAQPEDRKNTKFMAEHCRNLAIDLLANGERCLKHGRYEDAMVRGYRTCELLGQAALFDLGYDSENMTEGKRKIGRKEVIEFLVKENNPIGQKLNSFSEVEVHKDFLEGRNQSILIHGFSAKAPGVQADMAKLFEDIEALLKDIIGADAEEKLKLARWPSWQA